MLCGSAAAQAEPAQTVGSVVTPGADNNTAVVSTTGYWTIPRTGNANIGGNGTAFCVDVWLRPSATAAANGRNASAVTAGANYSGTEGNIFWDGDDTNQTRGFIAGLYLGRVYLSVRTTNGDRTILGTIDIRDGNWHLVSFQRDTDGTLSIYVGDDRDATNAGPTGDCNYIGSGTADDQHLHVLGKEKLNITGGYDGGWSDVRINTAIRWTGASRTTPTEAFSAAAGVVGLYHLDENTGTTANDYSSEANDGTLRGSPVPTWATADPFGGS